MEMGVSGASASQSDASLQLRPEMASRRLLVLAFVREYIGRWSQSPSHGEIANGLSISPTRARQLTKALVASGQLVRSPGPRGLSLPSARDEALRQLRALGYAIDEDILEAARSPCSHSTLRAPIVIDYVDGRTVERGTRHSSRSTDEPGREASAARGSS
jgi:hypothetical protein